MPKQHGKGKAVTRGRVGGVRPPAVFSRAAVTTATQRDRISTQAKYTSTPPRTVRKRMRRIASDAFIVAARRSRCLGAPACVRVRVRFDVRDAIGQRDGGRGVEPGPLLEAERDYERRRP